ncbi:uncharacterized protein RCC_02789 [Ramularia collo-cygni]|uniref:DUF974 domain protein n=1 Tax=Ramularia collo-cygni TaxID=112498 RepID=A0A2D3UXD8_9PEZI|nr:uncharacterized protein RCC_02789 [Ramularia collo-cygni]CZT16957.1 uncharacterized protein RCC_02789 [Ramularia collo-cygni]
MAQRTRSGTVSGPHAVSLKVLRLSRATLATQTPLPQTHFGSGLDISPKASLAYPSADAKSTSPLTPLLTLPASFGAAYVGETFTCTLCVNNELVEGDKSRSVSGVKITAELQTPAQHDGISLQLEHSSDATGSTGDDATGHELSPGGTLQRTLRHELKDEGPHVLAVTVSYTETLHTSEGGASGGRARTFRKLYQFVSQQLIAVRSKVTERKRRETEGHRQWVLEGQIENVGEVSVVLDRVWLKEQGGISSQALNGEVGRHATVLKPQDVEQIMFLLSEDSMAERAASRVTLAQVHIDWRSGMGEKGSLTTAPLASRGS